MEGKTISLPKLKALEINILEQIALEKTNKEIALKLNYSVRMIELSISKLFVKFNVRSRVGLIIKSISFGLTQVTIYNNEKEKYFV